MATTFSDQFFIIDTIYSPPFGTALVPVIYELVDENDDGFIDFAGADRIDGNDVLYTYQTDSVTINVPGEGDITYFGATFLLSNGVVMFSPTDGQALQAGTFVSSTGVSLFTSSVEIADLSPPCFVSGTLLDTPTGQRPVEHLKVGDIVMTADRGAQPVRWTGMRTIAGMDSFTPIRFAPGAMGNSRELLVSPQHRMLVQGWQAEMYFGESEVLVAAKHLVNGDTIHVQPMRHVTYCHILFDQHEIVYSEGIASESFCPGPTILAGDATLYDEITNLFPELDRANGDPWVTARCVLTSGEGRMLRI
ncbi:hypothetical protein FHS72_000764 [Loktanella ponticola]|uniref:Hedgehog/Intein (Hint) domain-containing protein n=1 Tax=Yoonia ponticola TaxID=1524255 RepID=A0A7W9BJ36_9RHOB|nr:Hint domain-containing protein [Yoonia ponticola]MBB5721157.1 hypothetical protein [Yoonia ponticola]